VHALYSVCRARLSPSTVSGLTPLGSTAEVAGLSGPGSLAHLLGLSGLVSAAADAWGPDDIKVEGALQALMKVRGGCMFVVCVGGGCTARTVWGKESSVALGGGGGLGA
jgi:hypothetical protein